MHALWMEGAARVTARGAAVKQTPSKTRRANFAQRPFQTRNFPENLKVWGRKSTASILDLLFIFRRQEMRSKLWCQQKQQRTPPPHTHTSNRHWCNRSGLRNRCQPSLFGDPSSVFIFSFAAGKEEWGLCEREWVWERFCGQSLMCSLTCFGGKVGVSLPLCHMTLNPREWCKTSEGTASFSGRRPPTYERIPRGKTCEVIFGQASGEKQTLLRLSGRRSERTLWVCQLRARWEQNSWWSSRLHRVAEQTWKGGNTAVIRGTGVSDRWKQRSKNESQTDTEKHWQNKITQ